MSSTIITVSKYSLSFSHYVHVYYTYVHSNNRLFSIHVILRCRIFLHSACYLEFYYREFLRRKCYIYLKKMFHTNEGVGFSDFHM